MERCENSIGEQEKRVVKFIRGRTRVVHNVSSDLRVTLRCGPCGAIRLSICILLSLTKFCFIYGEVQNDTIFFHAQT